MGGCFNRLLMKTLAFKKAGERKKMFTYALNKTKECQTKLTSQVAGFLFPPFVSFLHPLQLCVAVASSFVSG